MEKTGVVGSNDDMLRLRAPGLISIVGQPAALDDANPVAMPSTYVTTQDSEWYAEEAAALRGEFERGQARLAEYRRAPEDGPSLPETTGGLNLHHGGVV